VNLTHNNRMQRAGHDKVHAPDCHIAFTGGSCAQQTQRAVADAGRSAALPSSAGSTKIYMAYVRA
jgi:hypothetical protein